MSDLPHIDPRGEIPDFDPQIILGHCWNVWAIVTEDKDEYAVADTLRAYVKEHLQADNELYIAVGDELAKRKILSRAQLKNWLNLYEFL